MNLRLQISQSLLGTLLTNAGATVTAELKAVFAFAAVSPGLVVADGVISADLRVLSALIDV